MYTALEFAAAEIFLYTALEFATAAENFFYTALDQSTAWYKNFTKCSNVISLHIQDAGYKSSTARFSSRPGGYKGSINRKIK